MTDTASLQRLLTWLSPAFPVGAFAWSGGLETAIADRRVTDSERLKSWLDGQLNHGSLRTDAILLAAAHRAAGDPAELAEIAALCLALTSARERHVELTVTGASFLKAAAAWPHPVLAQLPDPCPYPIAIGAVAAAHDVGLVETLTAWLTAAVHQQVSVAIRLVPLGQTDGLRVIAALEPDIAGVAAHAANSTLADLGAMSYAADIAQMRHEALEPRIFRS